MQRTRPHVLGLAGVLLSAALGCHGAAQAQAIDTAAGLSAPAQTLVSTNLFGVELAAGTRAPTSAGATFGVRLPFGFRVRAHLGAMPTPYVDALSGIVSNAASLPEGTAAVLRRASVWNARLGVTWATSSRNALELGMSYAAFHASTSVDRATLESMLGTDLSATGIQSVGARLTLHAIALELAVRVPIGEHVFVRPGIGWVHAFAASLDVDVPAAFAQQAQQPLARAKEELLRWSFAPELQLEAGVAF